MTLNELHVLSLVAFSKYIDLYLILNHMVNIIQMCHKHCVIYIISCLKGCSHFNKTQMQAMGQKKRMSKWYFGGVAATGAAVCTHPLDTIKTILQTPHPTSCVNPNYKAPSNVSQPVFAIASNLHRYQKADGTWTFKEIGLVRQTVVIVRSQGVPALYKGLPASCLWLLISATTRFGIYEVWKQKKCPRGEQISFYERVYMSVISGFCGGIVGNPFDIVKIRMQNDVKLPGIVIHDTVHIFI